jgi:hypothetical protein
LSVASDRCFTGSASSRTFVSSKASPLLPSPISRKKLGKDKRKEITNVDQVYQKFSPVHISAFPAVADLEL